MKNQINIAELLKDCPKGMELDCTMWDFDVELDRVDENCVYCIKAQTPIGELWFNKYGCYSDSEYSKCVIFPKGKTSWEGFHRPFKDGDIVAFDNPHRRNNLQLFIFKDKKENNTLSSCYLMLDGDELDLEEDMYYVTRLATEEEKQKLFDAIKSNGYKWNSENKTLEKLIEPKFKSGDKIVNIYRKHLNGDSRSWKIYQITNDKYIFTDGSFIYIQNQDNWELINEHKFKVGDRIKQKGSPRCYIISSIESDRYRLNNNQFIRFVDEKIYELVPNKFDITTLKPFESRILVRNWNNGIWRPAIFGTYAKSESYKGSVIVVGGLCYEQCIPYKGNEHLSGTTNDCDEFFKTWKS